MFFRAPGLKAGLSMFHKILTDFRFPAVTSELGKKLHLDGPDLLIVGAALLIVWIVSILNEKGVGIRESLSKKNTAVRWAALYAFILFIVIFGAYGVGYIPVDPIYANF